MRALVAVVLLASCASGGDAESVAGDAATGTETSPGGCIFACEAPAPTCTSECEEKVSEAAGCDAGSCVFNEKKLSCPFGCDATTGRCHTPATGCAKIDCGKTTACGATCSTTSGCCTSSTYDRSTGLAVSGSRACCDDGDELTGTTDCGTGVNHGVNKEGTCAVSWEGAMNGGTPCATAHCRKRVCPG